jgi:hypothetical protein
MPGERLTRPYPVPASSENGYFSSNSPRNSGANKNVAGRQKRTFMADAGGAPKYRQKCDDVAARGYEGFSLA